MCDFPLQLGDALLVASIERQIADVIYMDDLADMGTLVFLNLGGKEFAVFPARPRLGAAADLRPDGRVGLEGAEAATLGWTSGS